MLRVLFFCLILFSLARAENTVQLNADSLDIKDLTKLVSQATGKNFIVPHFLKGKITVISSKPIPKKELLNLYIAALDELGYQAVEDKNYIKIVKKREVAKESSFVKSGKVKEGEKVLTYIIIPQHILVLDIQGLVRNLLSPVGRFSIVKSINAMVITDKEKNVKKIKTVLDTLDKSPLNFQVVSFEIKHNKAKNVARILRELFNKSFAQDLVKSFPIPGKDYYHIVFDENTNTLFVVGTPKVIERIKELLPKIDKEFNLEDGYLHIIRLNYAFAEDTEKVLNKLLKGDLRKKFGINRSVKVVADKSSNSLIVLADPKDFRIVERIISGIDIKRPQVFVEVQIVEMSIDKLSQLGVEWKLLNRGDLVPFAGSIYNFPVVPTKVSDVPQPRGLFFGVAKWRDNVPDIGFLLNAYAKVGAVNIVATPQVLTLDNEEAEVNITSVLPYSTGVKYDTNNNPVISYDYKDVGITLKITPHITASNGVKLKIYAKVEDVVGYANADQTAPITSKREAKTTVNVQDGQTLVIGGLTKNKKIITTEKVPLLGDIPFLGSLFRRKSYQIEKTNLLIFITPKVVRSEKEEEELTSEKRKFLQKVLRGGNVK
ncbi:MAG: type II secretion system secretin GspD [Desulfurobacteriaceae bacterium]